MLSFLVRMPRRRRLVAASALAVVMLPGGCSSGESSAPGGGTSSVVGSSAGATAPAGVSPSESAGGSGTGGTSAAPVDVTGTPLPVLASRTGQSDTTPVTVSLNEVRAAGKLMTVTWSVRNDGQEPWRVGDFFFSGRYAHGWTDQLGSELSGVASGIYVLDAVSARRYLPAQDKDGNCVCTSNTDAIQVAPGESTVLQAVFQAPPPEVATVQVVLPNIGPFDAVPVAR